jgi:hypothetical protein
LEPNKEGNSCLLSGGAPDSHCSMSGADLLPFLAQPTVGSPGWLAHRTLSGAHRTLSGAHRTVRCTPDSPVPPADRWLGPRVARGFGGRPLRWRPYSPVNYSRTPPMNSREWPVRQKPAWRTGHCRVHHRTVRCARLR